MKDPHMQQDIAPQQLEYARPGAETSATAAKVCLVIAYLCGSLPMIVGVGTLVLYWITRWDRLPLVGIFTIVGGLGLWFVGIGCLIAYAAVVGRAKVRDRRVVNRRSAGAMALLLANLPLAFGCTIVGYALATQYRITIINQTDVPIVSGILQYPHNERSFSQLAPGASKRFTLRADDFGPAGLVLTWPDGSTEAREVGVSLQGMGGDQSWTVQPDGTVSVSYH